MEPRPLPKDAERLIHYSLLFTDDDGRKEKKARTQERIFIFSSQCIFQKFSRRGNGIKDKVAICESSLLICVSGLFLFFVGSMTGDDERRTTTELYSCTHGAFAIIIILEFNIVGCVCFKALFVCLHTFSRHVLFFTSSSSRRRSSLTVFFSASQRKSLAFSLSLSPDYSRVFSLDFLSTGSKDD